MSGQPEQASALLRVEGLTVEFLSPAGSVRAVDDVSFAIPRGKTVGVVGESGSGKSVTALSVLRLLEGNTTKVSGKVWLEGQELLTLPPRAMRLVRGARIGMVFQDPAASVDPIWRVGSQIAEVLRLHGVRGRKALREQTLELLHEVGIPAPEERIDAYPHQLSGGMRQRVMIAMAVACRPDLIIADEPTTALDVTIQAQILALLHRLQRERGTSLLLISHDLALIAETTDELVVMYAGQVVERGHSRTVLAGPSHPYTAGLLASTPLRGRRLDRLQEIPGVVPDLKALPAGCRFQDRCPHSQQRCRVEPPALTERDGRAHRCHFPLEGAAG